MTLAAQIVGLASALWALSTCTARVVGLRGVTNSDDITELRTGLGATNRRIDSLVVVRDGREVTQRMEVARVSRWVVGSVKMQCLRADDEERALARAVDVPCDSLVGDIRRDR